MSVSALGEIALTVIPKPASSLVVAQTVTLERIAFFVPDWG
jgi:hypothetical protein